MMLSIPSASQTEKFIAHAENYSPRTFLRKGDGALTRVWYPGKGENQRAIWVDNGYWAGEGVYIADFPLFDVGHIERGFGLGYENFRIPGADELEQVRLYIEQSCEAVK